jgi:hypothetical protein
MDAVFFTNKKYQKKKIMVATKAIGITGALLRLINCSLISYLATAHLFQVLE